ncbi:N(5),N(10)-methenyltetrahydromethanopterin cyclohydrolase [Spirochaetia bacterium]|nr:N(5),N(10)-methenyltetrahydromethanopterin cyclohydrolase [Spirochaetia bacterium]
MSDALLENYSINDAAAALIESEMRPCQEALQIKFHTCRKGATVIDMGVHERAGFLAAKYFTEISLAGLGELRYTKTKIGGRIFPAAAIFVDHPVVAELSSHSAIWRIQHCGVEKNFSGPVRGKVQDAYSKMAGYLDAKTEKAVMAYQIDYLPSESLVDLLVEKARVRPENFYLMAARTGTMVGSVQIAARNVEQTLPTLVDKKFPMEYVVCAMAMAPIVAVNDDEIEAYGRVNDALIYGQETNLTVDCPDEAITALLPRLTMDQGDNVPVYGLPFKQIFAQYNNDWCQLPRSYDAPSKINFYNLRTGNSFSAGTHSPRTLLDAFYGEKGCVVQ